MPAFSTQTVDYRETRAASPFTWDVRYDLSFDGNAVLLNERVRLAGFDPGQATVDGWEAGAEAIWNDKVFFSDGNRLYAVKLDFDFVTAGEHNVVTVHQTGTGTDSGNWFMPEMSNAAVAHELGHLFGEFDAYAGGATLNGFTTTGTLMSDLTIAGFQNYFVSVEENTESFGQMTLSTVLGWAGTENANMMSGTAGMDGFYGLGGADGIDGRGGNDYIDGGAGDDSLIGGAGNDIIDGGANVDTVNYFFEFNDWNIDLATGIAQKAGETDTLMDVENVIGGFGNDRLIGNGAGNRLEGMDGRDVLQGGGGTDFLEGGADIDQLHGGTENDILKGGGGADQVFGDEGTDTLSYVGSSAGVTINLLTGEASGGDAQGDTFTTVEHVLGSGFGDWLTGDDKVNVLYGNEGNDMLGGLGGNDTLQGGLGDDAYYVEDSGDRVLENADQGTDTVHAWTSMWALGPNLENLVLLDADGIHSAGGLGYGNELNNVIRGNGIDNILNGGGRNDTIDGGGGHDTASYAGAHANYLTYTKTVAGVATTIVKDTVGSEGTDTLANIETLHFADGGDATFGSQQNRTMNVDGDRFDDVVYRSRSTGQVIYQNMEAGAPAGFDAITNPLPGWTAIGTGDVSGDGKADVFIWNSTDGFVYSVLPGASASPSYGMVAGGIKGAYSALGVTDINGDGLTDLLVREANSGSIYWQNAADHAWAYVGTNLGATWSYQAAGDVNHDGFSDVVIRDTSGRVYIASMANGANSGYVDLGNLTGYQVRAVADVNADGFADVVVQREADGWALWRDLSGNGPEWKVAAEPVGASWIIKDAADVDNDGSADLIFQNSTTGETLYRAMDAGVGTDWHSVSSPLGTDWVVV